MPHDTLSVNDPLSEEFGENGLAFAFETVGWDCSVL